MDGPHYVVFAASGNTVERPLTCALGDACPFAEAIRNVTADQPVPPGEWGRWLIEDLDDEGCCSLTRVKS